MEIVAARRVVPAVAVTNRLESEQARDMSILAPLKLVKQPAESRLYVMEFAALLADAETLTGVTSVLATPSGLTLSEEDFSGSQAQFRIAGGAHGQVYRLEVTVTTNQGNTLQGDGLLVVRDS